MPHNIKVNEKTARGLLTNEKDNLFQEDLILKSLSSQLYFLIMATREFWFSGLILHQITIMGNVKHCWSVDNIIFDKTNSNSYLQIAKILDITDNTSKKKKKKKVDHS